MSPKINLYEVSPVISIADMMEQALREVPDKIAYKYKTGEEIKSLTFKEFEETVFSLGAYLAASGLENSRAACIGNNFAAAALLCRLTGSSPKRISFICLTTARAK